MISIVWGGKWTTIHKSTFLLEEVNTLHQHLKLVKMNNFVYGCKVRNSDI